MVAKNTTGALRKLEALVKRNPQVEQDIRKWVDVHLEEIEKGEWTLTVNDEADQTLTFSTDELTINELYAARGGTKAHPTGTKFSAAITIDSPIGKRKQPGPFAKETPEETAKRSRDIIEKIGKPEVAPIPKATLGGRITKLVRAIRLRLRL